MDSGYMRPVPPPRTMKFKVGDYVKGCSISKHWTGEIRGFHIEAILVEGYIQAVHETLNQYLVPCADGNLQGMKWCKEECLGLTLPRGQCEY
jgi:hypothetical protein